MVREAPVTTEWVAKYFKKSIKAVQAWRYRGTGPPHFKVGNQVYYWPDEVVAWAESLQSEQNAREEKRSSIFEKRRARD